MFINNIIKAASKLASVSTLVLGATFSAAPASAASLLGQAPDASLIVLAGGYEWVYAAPCGEAEDSCGSVQLHHGFGFATDGQWTASFASLAELGSAFEIQGGAGKCAATYFSMDYDHCDFSDVGSGFVWRSPLGSDPLGEYGFAETFLVRIAAQEPVGVPEPGSLALIGLGLVGFAATRRKTV